MLILKTGDVEAAGSTKPRQSDFLEPRGCQEAAGSPPGAVQEAAAPGSASPLSPASSGSACSGLWGWSREAKSCQHRSFPPFRLLCPLSFCLPRLQAIADQLVERFVASGLMLKEWDRVKLHATVMNTLFRRDPGGGYPSSPLVNAFHLVLLRRECLAQ